VTAPADLLVDALAGHRLVRLVQQDTITQHWRDGLLHNPEATSSLVELLHCPWCLSVHVGAAITAARAIAPRWWGPLGKALAISSVVGLITERQPS
jgi:hypothetical protein